MEVQWTSLLVVSAVAVSIPLLFAILPGPRIPTVVGELSAGIALGSSGLGWIEERGPWLSFLFTFGLAFVLFLAGLETDPENVRGGLGGGWRASLSSPVGLAVVALAISLVLAFGFTVPLWAADVIAEPTLVAFLIASTSIGVLLAVLGEKGILRKPYGQRLLLMAVVADILTVLLLTIFFSTDESSTLGARLALIAALLAMGVVLFVVLSAARKRTALPALIGRLSGSTTQLPIRGSFAVLLAFVALASEFGLEIILGAFMAGAIISTLGVPRRNPSYQLQMDAIGHGFFVPAFFVLAGARLDVPALLDASDRLLLIPGLIVAIYLIKTVPMWLYRNQFTLRENLAAGALQSAQLTLTVAGVEIGRQTGDIDAALGSALIGVALINTIIAPIVFTRLMVGSHLLEEP